MGSVQYHITGYYQSQFLGFSKQNYVKKIYENQRKNIKIKKLIVKGIIYNQKM